MDSITVYTDGSCIPNPGPGGWAFIGVIEGKKVTEGFGNSGGESTNNRMELQAVINAISYFSRYSRITIFTDSNLTIKCAKGEWKRKANSDLWKRYDEISQGKTITFQKVKAHNGDYFNEMVDKLAKRGIRIKKKTF